MKLSLAQGIWRIIAMTSTMLLASIMASEFPDYAVSIGWLAGVVWGAAIFTR